MADRFTITQDMSPAQKQFVASERAKAVAKLQASRDMSPEKKAFLLDEMARAQSQEKQRFLRAKQQEAIEGQKAAVLAKSPALYLYMEKKGMFEGDKRSYIAPAPEVPEEILKKFQRERIFHPAMKALGWTKMYEAPNAEGHSAKDLTVGGKLKDIWVQKVDGEIVNMSVGQPAGAQELKLQARAEADAQARAIIQARADEAAKKDSTIPIFKLVSSEPGVTNVQLIDPKAFYTAIPKSVEVGMGSYETLGYLDEQAPVKDLVVPNAQPVVVMPPKPATDWLKHALPLLGVGVALWLILRKK